MNTATTTTILALAIHLAVSPCRAAENRTPYRVSPWIEAPATGVVFAGTFLVPLLLRPELEGRACGQCDPNSINAFDRPATENYSFGARRASDVLLIASMGLPLVVSLADVAIDSGSDGVEGWLVDSLVFMEALTANMLVMQVVKYTLARPRPFTYNPEATPADLGSFDSTLSFYSGHASTTFCAAVAFSSTFAARHPDSPWRWVVWGTSLGVAATTGVLRVEAGKHYWSDVLVGAAVGAAIGFVVPWLHRKSEPAEGSQLQVSVVPLGLAGAF